MHRSDFIKNFGLGAAGILLPSGLLETKPVKIYDNYVRGIAHYEFALVKSHLAIGASLQLQRELDNLYDNFAVQVNFENKRLGYIAAYENICIARMLDAGVKLSAKVSALSGSSDEFDEIAVEVYADLVSFSPKLIQNLNKEGRADDAIDFYRTE